MEANRIIGGGDPALRKKSDLYPTPPDVTLALMNLLSPILPGKSIIWEPACGDGEMVKVIERCGYIVIGTDIQEGRDFLTGEPPVCFDWIITNPPFSCSEDFIKRAAGYNKPFAFLLKSQYWHAGRRIPLFREFTPDIVAPLTWRPDFLFKEEGNHGAPLMDVMWCVWLPEIHKKGGTRFIPLEKGG